MRDTRGPRRSSPWGTALCTFVVAALSMVPGALAHTGGSGDLVETDLAVPAWVLWGAGGLVVAGSFMLVAAFQTPVGPNEKRVVARGKTGDRARAPKPGLREPWEPDPGLAAAPGAPRVGPDGLLVARAVGLVGWVLAWLPLVFPMLHPAPRPDVVVWVLLWAALPMLVVVFGDVWSWLDPFRSMGRLVQRVRPEGGSTDLVDPGDAVGDDVGKHRRQVRLARVVGLVSLLVAIGLELVLARWSMGGSPTAMQDARSLATAAAALAYSAFTVLMMFVFGARFWLEHGEFLGRLFRAWSSLRMRAETDAGGVRWGGPGHVLDESTHGRVPRGEVLGADGGIGTLRARAFLQPVRIPGSSRAVGDLSGVRDDGVDPRFAPGVPVGTPSWVEQAFVVAMLVGVNYDTLMHAALGAWASGQLLGALDVSARSASGAWLTAGVLLLLTWTLFLAIWLWSVLRMREAAEDREPSRHVGASFVGVLLPIALGYHVAHNLPQVIGSLPRLLPAALAGELSVHGWDWGPRALVFWSVFQVVAILGGHLLAVRVGHGLSNGRYASAIQSFRAEVPLTAVMVVYTLIGLGLLGSSGGEAPAVDASVTWVRILVPVAGAWS